MSAVEITSQDQFTELTSIKDKLIILYFYTTWASPCIQMNKVIRTLSESSEYSNDSFLSINADNNQEISDLFDVSAVPYFVLIRNGTILKEFSGADPKEFINHLNQFSTNGDKSSTSSPSSASDKNTPTQQQQQQQQESNISTTAETSEQLASRLSKLTTAAPIMLFMKGTPSAPQCGFSRQLVAILREHKVRFGFFDILKDDSVRNGLKEFSDWPTFPQLYINGVFQGGLDIIKENLADDEHFFETTLSESAN